MLSITISFLRRWSWIQEDILDISFAYVIDFDQAGIKGKSLGVIIIYWG